MNRNHPKDWKCKSPGLPGLHNVISPENSPLSSLSVFRLNLDQWDCLILGSEEIELNSVVISGEIRLDFSNKSKNLIKMDSFFLPGKETVKLTAIKDCTLFIAGAEWKRKESFFIRKFNHSLPLGSIHQIQGESPFERETWMTLSQDDSASGLMCGLTWGRIGAWTGPFFNNEEIDHESVFCYFDIPEPQFALHLSSRFPDVIEVVHPVQTGDFVIAPNEYHSSVGMPGARSSYFWAMKNRFSKY